MSVLLATETLSVYRTDGSLDAHGYDQGSVSLVAVISGSIQRRSGAPALGAEGRTYGRTEMGDEPTLQATGHVDYSANVRAGDIVRDSEDRLWTVTGSLGILDPVLGIGGISSRELALLERTDPFEALAFGYGNGPYGAGPYGGS